MANSEGGIVEEEYRVEEAPTAAQREQLASIVTVPVADSGHPLTGRVAVNRFRHGYFRVGLVKTLEDWGIRLRVAAPSIAGGRTSMGLPALPLSFDKGLRPTSVRLQSPKATQAGNLGVPL